MRSLLGMLAPAVVASTVLGCGSGEPPDIIGLTDQVAVVGQELVVELMGVDPDGGRLKYSVDADVSLEGTASLSQTPSGNGVFRWTPTAADLGVHGFDFKVSDGDNDTTVSIQIDVRSTADGLPIFRQPLGTGRVLNLATDPCISIDIVIEDADSAQVDIGEEEPLIDGATLMQQDGLTATWQWCPTPAQVASSDRYTLTLTADDNDNPKTRKMFVIVIGGGGGPAIVINEIDYDNIGSDTSEYIELLNRSGGVASLAGLKVVLVNGATSTAYSTIDLSSLTSLDPGQYLVIARSVISVPAAAKRLDPLWTQDQIQNGDQDGLVLIDDVTKTVLDALSYEGSITAATITGFPSSVSLVEGTALDPGIADSNDVIRTLCRAPNGQDTNNASADFKLCNSRSTGATNVVP